MNAGIENNAGAMAPEGVMDGTPEITEDNLFDLVDSGRITLDEANEWIRSQEESSDGFDAHDEVNPSDSSLHSSQEEEGLGGSSSDADNEVGIVPGKTSAPDEGGVVPEGGKPFRVYNTQEEFQRDFDRSWNARYGKMKEESEKKDAEHNALLSDLAELLKVTPDKAAEELRRRKLTRQAEAEGKDADDLYTIDKLRSENEQLKKLEERRKFEATVADINAQGEAIRKVDPSFDINEAMKNPDFARQVFFTRQTNPARAVEVAYKIFYGDKATSAPAAVPAAPPPARPSEGAVAPGAMGEKKPVDFSRMSSDDIRALDKKIMSGEKIEL